MGDKVVPAPVEVEIEEEEEEETDNVAAGAAAFAAAAAAGAAAAATDAWIVAPRGGAVEMLEKQRGEQEDRFRMMRNQVLLLQLLLAVPVVKVS